jgi:FlaA1/EpsC-like NDP-sugar epimerase
MKLNRFIRNRFIFIADLFLVIACVLGSFVLRLNLGPLFMDHLERAGVMLLVALILKPLVYYSFGLYRRLWVYASVQELKLITVAVTTASILVATIIVLLQALKLFQAFSRGVLVIDWLLSLLAVGGLRFALRVIAESRVINASPLGKKKGALWLLVPEMPAHWLCEKFRKHPSYFLGKVLLSSRSVLWMTILRSKNKRSTAYQSSGLYQTWLQLLTSLRSTKSLLRSQRLR